MATRNSKPITYNILLWRPVYTRNKGSWPMAKWALTWSHVKSGYHEYFLVYGFPSLPFVMYRVFLLSLTCSHNFNNSFNFHKTLSKQFNTNTQMSSLLTRNNYPMLHIEHWIILDIYGPNFVNKHFGRQVCLAIPWYRHSSCACLWRTFTLLFKIKIYSS